MFFKIMNSRSPVLKCLPYKEKKLQVNPLLIMKRKLAVSSLSNIVLSVSIIFYKDN